MRAKLIFPRVPSFVGQGTVYAQGLTHARDSPARDPKVKDSPFPGIIPVKAGDRFRPRPPPGKDKGMRKATLYFMLFLYLAGALAGCGETDEIPAETTSFFIRVTQSGEYTREEMVRKLPAGTAREYMASIGRPVAKEIHIVGYSQGGAVALAFQKMAEERYAAEIPIKKVIAGGGPYDLAASYDYFIRTDEAAFPCSIPLSVIGLDYGDNLQLDYRKVFREPLLSHYREWFGSKAYTTSSLNERLGSHTISMFMNADLFRPGMNPEFRKLYVSLEKNSLVAWTPRSPVLLVHGRTDTYVPYFNALHAYARFKSGGCPVELYTTPWGHLATVVPFYLQVTREVMTAGEGPRAVRPAGTGKGLSFCR